MTPMRANIVGPQLPDVIAGVLERHELATAGQRYWIVK
jgi:hypothetical protein